MGIGVFACVPQAGIEVGIGHGTLLATAAAADLVNPLGKEPPKQDWTLDRIAVAAACGG